MLEAVDQDRPGTAVLDVLLSLIVDANIWNDELVVWDRDLKARIYGKSKIAIISGTMSVGFLFVLVADSLRSLGLYQHSIESDGTRRSVNVRRT